jgi:hypothetical protein
MRYTCSELPGKNGLPFVFDGLRKKGAKAVDNDLHRNFDVFLQNMVRVINYWDIIFGGFPDFLDFLAFLEVLAAGLGLETRTSEV